MLNKNTWRILGGALLVALFALFLVSGLKSILPRDSMLAARVSPRVMQFNDSMYFVDSSDFADKRRWLFGDGNFSTAASGVYRYAAPGNYVVTLLVNETIRDSFFVRVEGTGYQYTAVDSVFKIIAPPAALQHENVLFRVEGYGSDEFLWDFGDGSPRQTARLSVVRHAYKKPGVYTVSLFSRNNQQPDQHKIIISPEFEWLDTSALTVAGKLTAGVEGSNDFRERLKKIVEEGRVGNHYAYLLNRYACGNADMPVQVNGSDTQPFYLYCQNLIFNSRLQIQSVELNYDQRGECAVSVRIRQQE